jgi:hypothetical protein
VLAVGEDPFTRQLSSECVESVDEPTERSAPVARPAPVGGEDEARVRSAPVKDGASQRTKIHHVLGDDRAALNSSRLEDHRVRSTHEIGTIQDRRRVMPAIAEGRGRPPRPHLIEEQLQARS